MCRWCRELQRLELFKDKEWAQRQLANAEPCDGACDDWAADEERELAELRGRSAGLRGDQPHVAGNVAAWTQRIADGLLEDIDEWHRSHIAKVSDHANRILETSATFACGGEQCFVY